MEHFNLMISINVRTLGETAKDLKTLIEENLNAKVWICTDMTGGQNYRDEIVKAIDKALVVILLVNDAWANSAECEDEYNYAKRLNLTSQSDPRKPFLLPIAFPDLNWQRHSHIRLLMSSTNAITAKDYTAAAVWPTLKASLIASGFTQSVIDTSGHVDFKKHINRDTFLIFGKDQLLQWISHVGLPGLKPHIESELLKATDLIDITSEDLTSLGLDPFQCKKTIKILSEYKLLPKDFYRAPVNSSDVIIGKDAQILIGNTPITLYQHTATSVYITLLETGPKLNFSSYIVPTRKPWGMEDTDVYTHFTKIRFDPQSMTVDTSDYTFAKSSGHCGHHRTEGITEQFPYATCFDCERDGSHGGKGNINLRGTPFAVDDKFKHQGWNSNGTWDFSEKNQVVQLTGGGFCGWTCPSSCADELAAIKGGWVLKLKFVQ